jgi:hypothetical protein
MTDKTNQSLAVAYREKREGEEERKRGEEEKRKRGEEESEG